LSSIYTPIHIPVGSLRPTNIKFSTVMIQMFMFMILMPLAQAMTLLPLGAEALLESLGWSRGLPVGLLLSLAEAVVAVLIWLLALSWQGRLLQAREQAILETVTNRAP